MGKTDQVGSDCKAYGVCTELRIRIVDVYATRVQPHQKLNCCSHYTVSIFMSSPLFVCTLPIDLITGVVVMGDSMELYLPMVGSNLDSYG